EASFVSGSLFTIDGGLTAQTPIAPDPVTPEKWAMDKADRAAYQRIPEQPDDFWDDAEAWGAE
ncbi:MAG: hypothetical protein OXH58_06260, partial [Acidimicrobiaceae bacterium]|nr:hypothetical protein [Acidimicrobiaceae bacterium]